MIAEQDQTLYVSKSGPLKRADFAAALKAAGLRRGDVVMAHSDVGRFGKIGDVLDRERLLGSLLEAFREAIGPEGTLLVPTYTYSFCNQQPFDVLRSKSTVGAFSEFVRTRPGAIRSEDAIFSHAGLGPKAAALLAGVGEECFGEDSVFGRLHRAGGKILTFGNSFEITFLHYIERRAGVAYRKDKTFNGQVVGSDGRPRPASFTYLVRRLEDEGFQVETSLENLKRALKDSGKLGQAACGDAEILCASTADCLEAGLELLRADPHAFLGRSPHVLSFTRFPFALGALETADNHGLPVALPLSLELNAQRTAIVQRYSKEVDECNAKAYKAGSMLSTNVGQGSFGARRADETIAVLARACGGGIQGARFLEVGCGDGYLLSRLKEAGAGRVMGCEPGPAGKAGARRFGVDVVNEFYAPGLIAETFDVVFSSGVLEHLHDPGRHVRQFAEALVDGGRVFAMVPNCERKLALGDISIVAHEHWNYFTSRSLEALFRGCGLVNVESAISRASAFIFAWGTKRAGAAPPAPAPDLELERLFARFCSRVAAANAALQEKIERLERAGRTLGLYAGGVELLGPLRFSLKPRFFDGDAAKHGKFVSGFESAIENPVNLVDRPVDSLWIAATDYDEEIRGYLSDELKVPARTEIVSIKTLLERLA